MPRWKIEGADRQTGADLVFEVEAVTETAAIHEAGKRAFIACVHAAPEATGHASALHGPIRRFAAPLITVAAAALVIAGALWSEFGRSRRPTTQVATTFEPIPSSPARPVLTAPAVTRGFETFNVVEVPAPAGTRRLFAKHPNRPVSLRLDARSGSIEYAHISVPETGEIRESLDALDQFLRNVAGDWNREERETWLYTSVANRAGTTSLPGRRVVMEFSDGRVKLGVTTTP